MTQQRKQYSAQQKVRILREHLVEKVPVSDLCDRHGLSPNVFYRWQKQFFENGAMVFDGRQRHPGRQVKQLEVRNQALQARLADKDEVIAEIMADHVRLKKSLGEI